MVSAFVITPSLQRCLTLLMVVVVAVVHYWGGGGGSLTCQMLREDYTLLPTLYFTLIL